MHARPPNNRPFLPFSFLCMVLIVWPCLANDSCGDAIAIACGDTVSGDTTGAMTDGDWPCALGGSEVWYSFVATEPVTILDFCGSTYDTAVMILDGCDGAVLGCNDDYCGLQSRLVVGGLTVGNTYLIAVGGYNGIMGAFTMEFTCRIPVCDGAHVQPGDVEEDEDSDCGLDSFNGGCNSTPPTFSPIECSQYVHGTSGTNDAIGYRDTDWWLFNIVGANATVTWTVTAEFPVVIGFVAQPCPQTAFLTFATADACTPVTVTTAVPPGLYVAFVAPSSFAGVLCGAEYRGSFFCGPCCGPPPPPNDDCADSLPINCDETVLGDTTNATTDGFWPCTTGGSEVWYDFVATGSVATVDLCGASYDTTVMVTDGCGGAVLACNDDACGVQSSLYVGGLVVGQTYRIAVGGYAGAMGSFAMSLSCGDPPPCAEALPGDIEENEPEGGCAYEYVDDFNGGCSSNPPAYSSLSSGDTVHGQSGTFWRDGLEDRDTDWWRVTIEDTDATLSWTVTADFPVLIGFVSLPCEQAGFIPGTVRTAAPCTEVTSTTGCLPPGEYVAFVSPVSFSGIPCGSQYRGTLTATPCEPPCAGDLNGDRVRDIADLAILLSQFGSSGGPFAADLDADDDVDIQDLALLLSEYGVPC